jgi:hypothetical protein
MTQKCIFPPLREIAGDQSYMILNVIYDARKYFPVVAGNRRGSVIVTYIDFYSE